MKKQLFKVCFLTIISLSINELLVAQQVNLNIDQLMFLGKVPQKSPSNILVDKLDYILSSSKDSTSRVGYLNDKGKIKIPAIYNMGLDFYGDYANVVKNSRPGIIDKEGNIKLFKNYEKVIFYNDSIGIAYKNKLAALINNNGILVTDFIYNRIDIYGYNYFKANVSKKESYIINQKGERVYKLTPKIKSHFLIDSILIYEDIINGKRKQGLLNINGNKILPAEFDKLSIAFDKNDMMLVKNDGKQGYINRRGEIIIPIVYNELKNGLNEGLIAAKKGEKWGFINKNNKTIVPFVYDDAQGFTSGLAYVKVGKHYGYIDKKNKVKIPFKFKKTKYAFFIKNRAIFKDTITEKYGFIDKKGNVKINAVYDIVFPFYKDKAFVRLNEKEGFINRRGEEVIPIRYKQLWLERNGMIRFVE